MAPIFASIGITPQIIDDERLRAMRSCLESMQFNGPLNNTHQTSEKLRMPLDIERLVGILEPWQSWTFEEQVSSFYLFGREAHCSQFFRRSHVTHLLLYLHRLTFKNGLMLWTESMHLCRSTSRNIRLSYWLNRLNVLRQRARWRLRDNLYPSQQDHLRKWTVYLILPERILPSYWNFWRDCWQTHPINPFSILSKS